MTCTPPLCCLLLSVALASCGSGVRDLDFINKQFQVTYNLDSTRTIDSTRLIHLRQATAIYTFGEDETGVTHIRTGMVSTDRPFTWTLNKDTLTINRVAYTVRKQDKGFVLVNDSVKFVLSQQP